MVGIKHHTTFSGTKIATDCWNEDHDKGATADVLNDHDKTLHDNLGITPATHGNSVHSEVYTTKTYVDGLIEGLDWQQSVYGFHDPSSSLPSNPSVGDRYVSAGTANGWIENYIYTWTGQAWSETLPSDGAAVYVEDLDEQYVFNTVSWIEFGGGLDAHASLTTGVHGVGTGTIAKVSDIASDTNLSVNTQDAVSKRHNQNTDTGTTAANFAINGSNAVKEGDSRLTDARTPTSHDNTAHSATYITVSSVTDANLTTTDVTTNDVSTSKHGFTPKAPNDTSKFLRGDATWQVPNGGSATPDISYNRRTGTTRARWFTVPTTCTAMTVSTALTANRIYAHPFIVPKTITLDSIAINCTTLVSGGGLRLGIYSSTNGEPYTLVLDAGTVSTGATGVQSISINQQLTAGLYWLAAASSHATHAFRVPAIASTINIFGVASTLGTAVCTHLYAAHTYGALPSTFPTPTEGTSLVYPAIFVRLSA